MVDSASKGWWNVLATAADAVTAMSPSQSGKEEAVVAGIRKSRIAATSKGKGGLENLGSAIYRTL
jgi:hypothetical protein